MIKIKSQLTARSAVVAIITTQENILLHDHCTSRESYKNHMEIQAGCRMRDTFHYKAYHNSLAMAEQFDLTLLFRSGSWLDRLSPFFPDENVKKEKCHTRNLLNTARGLHTQRKLCRHP